MSKINIVFTSDSHDISSTLFITSMRESINTLISDGCPLKQLSIITNEKNLNLINTNLGQLDELVSALEGLQCEYITGSNNPDGIKNLFAKIHHKLIYIVGQYNYEVEHKSLLTKGLTSIKTAQKKAHKAFLNKYCDAIRLTEFILEEFYSEQANHPYPPKVVLKSIVKLCEDNNICYPEDLKSAKFKSFIQPMIKDIKRKFVITNTWHGAPEAQFKVIPDRSFQKKFNHLINRL
ncbi:hypothetical protein V8687_21105 [Shewanella baltica]|uniref:hypothetical protein n=1 Tax=Shewanella baltica TaxID=62322 RepID=UPI0030CCAC48